MATWATRDDVFDLTRKEVSDSDLAIAQSIIQLEAGTRSEFVDSDISTANQALLTEAVCWQAAWVQAHPDVLETMDVEGVSQDGLSAKYASQSAHFLAPLAARCLRRLSWKLAPLRVRTRRRAFIDVGNRDDAVRDDGRVWASLPWGSGNVTADPMSQRYGQVST